MAHVIGEILKGVWRSTADQVITLEDGFEVHMKLPELLAGCEDFGHMAEGIYRQQSQACMEQSLPFPARPKQEVVSEIERGLKLAFVEWLTEASPRMEEACFVMRWTGISLDEIQRLRTEETARFDALWRVLLIVAGRLEATDKLRQMAIFHTAMHDGDCVEMVKQQAVQLGLDPDAVIYFEAALSRRDKTKADLMGQVVRGLKKQY